MTVKAIIDAARSAPGYAGIAIFAGGQFIYAEHIPGDYAVRLSTLYGRLNGKSAAGHDCLCAVAAGFTFYVYPDGGLTVILRMAGRFSPCPQSSRAEPDYAEPLADAVLPSRSGVRREAEALLRQYDLLK